MKSSRNSANISSARTNEARRANHVTTVCTATKSARSEHDAVDVRRRRARDDGLDERAEQRRAGEAGAGGERVEGEDARERPAVAPAERPRLEAQLGAVRDRQEGAHGRSLTRPLPA